MRFWITVVIVALMLLLASRDGGAVERRIAKTFALAFVIDLASRLKLIPGQTQFLEFDPVLFFVELAVLFTVIQTALRANRVWTLWASALQLLVVVSHLAKLVHYQGLAQVYWGMTTIPTYAEYMILLLGIYSHSRRVSRIGPYPEWRPK